MEIFLDLNNFQLVLQLRPLSVGFDDVFDHFQGMFDHQYDSINTPNYPPYNIIKTGKYTYDIQVALAGYGKKDVDVSFENNISGEEFII